MSFIDGLRAAADNGLQVVSQKSMNGYKIYLVNIIDDQINFDDTASARVRTDTRITVGQGFLSYAPGDGYLNPHIQYVTKGDFLSNFGNGTMALGGGALTDMEIILGPLVFPYVSEYQAGGFDPALFQPGPTAAANTQIYVHILGLGLNQANGNYFKVQEVALAGMDNVYYYVRLTALSDVIP